MIKRNTIKERNKKVMVIRVMYLFKINLQLFGGGGSKSGLGGGGSGTGGDKPSGPTGYIFFYQGDMGRKRTFHFVEGKNMRDIRKEAEKWGKEHGMLPGDPINQKPMTKEDAKKYLEERLKNRGKKK